jgi:hypothetical protein
MPLKRPEPRAPGVIYCAAVPLALLFNLPPTPPSPALMTPPLDPVPVTRPIPAPRIRPPDLALLYNLPPTPPPVALIAPPLDPQPLRAPVPPPRIPPPAIALLYPGTAPAVFPTELLGLPVDPLPPLRPPPARLVAPFEVALLTPEQWLLLPAVPPVVLLTPDYRPSPVPALALLYPPPPPPSFPVELLASTVDVPTPRPVPGPPDIAPAPIALLWPGFTPEFFAPGSGPRAAPLPPRAIRLEALSPALFPPAFPFELLSLPLVRPLPLVAPWRPMRDGLVALLFPAGPAGPLLALRGLSRSGPTFQGQAASDETNRGQGRSGPHWKGR